MVTERYAHNVYLIRREVFKLLGGAYSIYDPSGQICFSCKQKAFKLKEDIRVFASDQMNTEVLSIQARNVVDFSAAYDVMDPTTGEKVGVLRRKGWSSMVRDEWEVLDASENPIGTIREDSMGMALLRRLFSNLIPQKFHCEVDGRTVWTFQQNFNPFVLKITLDFSMDTENLLDRRLGVAAALLLCAIEGRQN
ncbi:MAG: hypothetical protein ACOCZU_05490 [Planctomycetota bacterium]